MSESEDPIVPSTASAETTQQEVTIPEELAPSETVSALHPQYQYIELSPYEYINHIPLKTNQNSTDLLTFEIPANNVMNLAKCFISCDVELTSKSYSNTPTDAISTKSASFGATGTYATTSTMSLDLFSYNIAYLRVYTLGGQNLFYIADNTYNDYIDFIRPLVRKKDDVYCSNFKNLFYDGATNYEPFYDSNTDARTSYANNKKFIPYHKDLFDTCSSHTVKYTMLIKFSELYNSILAHDIDIFFGEKIKIDIKFGPIENMACTTFHPITSTSTVMDSIGYKSIYTDPRGITAINISNFKLHMCYNQDAECNENTINYCLSDPINIADFHCITYNWNNNNQNYFDYQFNLNNAYGPYLKYILLDLRGTDSHSIFDKHFYSIANCSSLWKINDWALTPDYIKWDNWEKVYDYQDMFYDTWYLHYTNGFEDQPFELLSFNDYSLADLSNKDGKSLEKEVKFTYYIKNPDFVQPTTESEKTKYTNAGKGVKVFKFYILTGRVLKINKTGVESVM